MNILFSFLILFQGVIGFILYRVLTIRRRLFSDRYGMIIAMCCSSVLSMSLSMNFYFLLPLHDSSIFLINLLSSGSIGIMFGALVKYQSILSGYSHALMGGMIGTMIGAVIQNPSLCSLPSSYLYSVEQNMVIFSIFFMILVSFTFFFIIFSLKV